MLPLCTILDLYITSRISSTGSKVRIAFCESRLDSISNVHLALFYHLPNIGHWQEVLLYCIPSRYSIWPEIAWQWGSTQLDTEIWTCRLWFMWLTDVIESFYESLKSSVHWDREQCEKGGIGAINKTGLDYFTVYFCQSRVYPYSSVHIHVRCLWCEYLVMVSYQKLVVNGHLAFLYSVAINAK